MSEPAAVAVETPPDFAAFEASENAQALGETPPPPVAKPEEPEPEPEPEPEVAAEPATPTPEKPVSKRQQHINELARGKAESDQRAEALEARAAAAEAKLAALEAKAAPSVEPVHTPAASAAPAPTRPEPTEDEIGTKYDTYTAFARDLAKWVVEQERAADAATQAQQIRTVLAQERAAAQFETAIQSAQDRARKAYPDFDTLLDGPAGQVLLGRTEREAMERVAFIATHPQSEHIQYAILKDPALAQRLGQSDPYTFGLTIGSLLTSASASAGPAAKPVTTAPAPPTTLAARSADPADPVAAAVARGDYLSFEAEENRRAVAASR